MANPVTKKLTEDDKSKVRQMLMQGFKPATIAIEMKLDKRTVQKIGKGVDFTLGGPRRPTGMVEYGRPERLKALNYFIEKAHIIAEECVDEFRFKALADAVVTLIESRRLEDGIHAATADGQAMPFRLDITVKSGQEHADRDDTPGDEIEAEYAEVLEPSEEGKPARSPLAEFE